MADDRDDYQGENNHYFKNSLRYQLIDQSDLRQFSDESDLFSDISNRHREVTSQHSLERCLDHKYKPSREQLELLQKHNVVTVGGMLLVDPIENQKANLIGCNHSLTNHDLFIVKDERYRDEDEFSLVSNVTEVTYGIEKRETTPGRHQVLGGIYNPTTSEMIQPGCSNIGHLENILDSLRLRSSCGNVDQQNAPDIGPTMEKILVCITSTYIATLDEMKDENEQPITERSNNIGIRCTWNEPALSHKLGATFIEGSDGRAYVSQVVFGSHAASYGVKKGDAVSVSIKS